MQIQEKINQERRTWDKARFRRNTFTTMYELRSRFLQLKQEADKDQDALHALKDVVEKRGQEYASMQGLPGEWEALRDTQLMQLQRLLEDTAAEIRYADKRVERLDNIVERLENLQREAEQATE